MNKTNREIIALAAPAIVTNITTPLLGLVDTALTGHMGHAAYIGAISVGAGMLSLAYWPLNFLRMGTSGITAQAYGRRMAGAADSSAVILWRSLIVGLLASAVLLITSPWLGPLLLRFMHADSLTTSLAATYFSIVIAGAPAVLATYSLTGWFLGMQNTGAPMWMAIATNIANIAISALLVFGCGMRIEGVAIGTAAAQWIGLATGAFMALRHYPQTRRRMSFSALCRADELKRFFSVNTDIFLRTLCLAAVTITFTRTGAQGGPDILAANALLMQLFILFSYFMDGFAFSAEALSGKYHGMGSPASLSSTVRALFCWGTAIALAFAALYAAAGRYLLEILTSQQSVISTALGYMPWAVAVPIAGFGAFIWDGVFIGVTRTRGMLLSMAAAVAVYFTVGSLLAPRMHNHALWLAFIAYLATRSLMQTLIYNKK